MHHKKVCLPLVQGTEFKLAPVRRTRNSLWPSTHRRRSSESASSCTFFNYSWISSSQQFQKETRRTYHLLMLRFTFVSTDSGSGLRGTNCNVRNPSRFTRLARSCARSNTGKHVSLPQSIDRDIVTAGKPVSSAIVLGQTSDLGLSVSVCIQLCQVLSLTSSALDGEARQWACITSLGTLSIALEFSRTAS